MNKFEYFFLMLKQGIKGVFKFKAQFIIILILSFIATLILSVSISSGRRMQASYDQVMGKVEKFSYESQLTVDVQNNQMNLGFSPIKNVIYGDFSTIYYNEKDPSQSKTNFNFVLSHPEIHEKRSKEINEYSIDFGYKETNHKNFINQTYKNDKFIENFQKVIFGLTEKDIDKIQAGSNDNPQEKERKEKYAESVAAQNEMRLELLNTLIADLDALSKGTEPVDSNLKYSPIGQYTIKNPLWYETFVEFNSTANRWELVNWIDNIPTRLENLNGNNFDYFAYLLNAVDSVILFFNRIKMNLNWAIRQIYQEDISNEQLYVLIFGFLPPKETFEKAKNINPNWIINDENQPYSITVEAFKQKSDYVFLNNTDHETDGQLIAKNGFKGIISPWIDSSSTNPNNWNNIKSTWFSEGFNFIPPEDEKLLSYINVFENPIGLRTATYKNVIRYLRSVESLSLFLTHHRLTADAFDYDFKTRREATILDPTGLTYRGIILDENEDYNFTVLKGRNLVSKDDISGEVLLSEQFAKEHKIKIGSLIQVVNATYLVVGFGTDAFSFIPSQDLLNPIPNPKISSFIYGNAEVIKRLYQETGSTASAKNQLTQILNFLYWNRGSEQTMQIRRNAYLASLADSADALNNNFAYIRNAINNKDNGKLEVSSPYGLTSFNESNYRYSWTLPPVVNTLYLTVAAIASAIIIVIVIIALVICVRKTVQFNSKQIGILKAMGASPGDIAISYISYSIIISLVIVPVGWIAGILLQIPFANLFQTYFSIEPDIIYFDWIPFVITFFGIGILSAIIAYLSAYVLTGKSVMKILSTSVKWHNSKVLDWFKIHTLKKSSFKFRFSLTLASAGSRQIWLMAFVVLITSVLITASLVIPSVAATTNRLYYRNIRYSNEYHDQSLTVNAPLSKNTINYWEGQEPLQNDYVDKNIAKLPLDNSGNLYGYYKKLNSYYATISNGMVLPEYLYKPDSQSFEQSFLSALKDTEHLMPLLQNVFGSNFYNVTGQGFSIGMIDALFGIILHSLVEPTNDDNKNVNQNFQWTDEDKISSAQDFSRKLAESIPEIISMVINSSGGSNDRDSETNITWKESIMNVLYSNLPSYVKNYVQRSDSRLDQYAITYQNEIYIPGQETLITQVDGSASGQNLSLVGLDENQNSIVLNKEDYQKVYFPDEIKQKIYQVFDNQKVEEDIVYKGKKIYDAATNSLTLPILPNRQAQSHYKLKRNRFLNDFKHDVQGLKFLNSITNEYVTLPSGAWIYDDTSYVNLAKTAGSKFVVDDQKYETVTDATKTKYYLNPYILDNNKFSYKAQYLLDNDNKDTTSLVNEAFIFKDLIFKDKKVESAYSRPYYQYKDVKLMLPKAYITNIDQVLYPGINHGKNPTEENKTWYEEISVDQVPESVRTAWNSLAGEELEGGYLVINPYDIRYYDKDIEREYQGRPGEAMKNLTSHPGYWYLYSNEGLEPPLVVQSDQRTYLNKDLKVNFESVGVIASFNGNTIVIDSDFANKLLGVPTARQYQYNYEIFENEGMVEAGKPDSKGTISQFDRYQVKDVKYQEKLADSPFLWKGSSLTFPNELKAEDYAPHRWYNGKLSNVEEPLNFSSIISYTGSSRLGNYAIGAGSWDGIDIGITNESSELLKEKQALISQLSTLAISIGVLLIFAIIITASLLIMLVGDIYIAQYRRFMVLMRALGYSNWSTFVYSLGTVTVIAFIMLVAGHVLGWLIVLGAIISLDNAGIALPFGFNWWVIAATIVIILFSYFVSLLVSSHQARKDSPSQILTATAE